MRLRVAGLGDRTQHTRGRRLRRRGWERRVGATAVRQTRAEGLGDGGSGPRAQASAMAVQWRRGRPRAEVLGGGGGGTDVGKRVVDVR